MSHASPPTPQPNPRPDPQSVPTTEPLAIVALICAIGSWVLVPVILAIVALVLAQQADRSIAASNGWREGKGMVTAARVLAWIHLGFIVLVILFAVAFLIGIVIAN
jgi:hypothetical protein